MRLSATEDHAEDRSTGQVRELRQLRHIHSDAPSLIEGQQLSGV
jgi:hypothetical protein